MANQANIHVTAVKVTVGKKRTFKLRLDGREVKIQVDEEVFTNYQNQFYKENPTPLQKKKFSTVMKLMEAAYLQGVSDGKATK